MSPRDLQLDGENNSSTRKTSEYFCVIKWERFSPYHLYSFKYYVLKLKLTLLCRVLYPNTEGANIPTQRRLQTWSNQLYLHGVSRSTGLFLLLRSTHYCFIRDSWCTAPCLVSAPLSAVGLVTPLRGYLHRCWGDGLVSARSQRPGPPGAALLQTGLPSCFGTPDFPDRVTWMDGKSSGFHLTSICEADFSAFMLTIMGAWCSRIPMFIGL